MRDLETPPAAAGEQAREQLGRQLEPQVYDEIRELWKRHSIAEEHRDLPGLIATLTEDCVYEIPAWKQRWEGHAGATQFYNGLLTAFPDIHFALTDIVILPITASLGRGCSSGASSKPAEPYAISGPVSDACALRCQIFAWRNW